MSEKTYTENEYLHREASARGFARLSLGYEVALLGIVVSPDEARTQAIQALGWGDTDEAEAVRMAEGILAEGYSVRRACDDLTPVQKAAPDLLEALEEAKANVERVTDGGRTAVGDLQVWLRRARAAVAKARGEVGDV